MQVDNNKVTVYTDNETGKLMTVREAKEFYKDYDSTKEEGEN